MPLKQIKKKKKRERISVSLKEVLENMATDERVTGRLV